MAEDVALPSKLICKMGRLLIVFKLVVKAENLMCKEVPDRRKTQIIKAENVVESNPRNKEATDTKEQLQLVYELDCIIKVLLTSKFGSMNNIIQLHNCYASGR